MEYLQSLATGAVDTARGVVGLETGEHTTIEISFDHAVIGLRFDEDGYVTDIQPGSEAASKGVRLSDYCSHVGGTAVVDRSSIAFAIASHAARPLSLAFERREARNYKAQLGSVNFRLDEECVKAETILRTMLDSLAGPHPHVIRHCLGLVFLRVTKVAFQAGVSWGTGCVVARLPGGGWSPPSAVGTTAVSIGWQIGAEVEDLLVVLHGSHAVRTFSSGGAVRLGTSVSVAVGPLGGGNELNLDFTTEDVTGTFTYTLAKGLFAGLSLDGAEINERNAVNAHHYAAPVRASEILCGKVQPTPACANLHALLGELDRTVPPHNFSHQHYYHHQHPPQYVYVQQPPAYVQQPHASAAPRRPNWSCRHCTLDNPGFNSVCGACGQPFGS